MTQVRELLRGLPNETGVYTVGPDATVEILERRADTPHTHIRGVWPPETTLESSFTAGPLFTFFVRDGIADTRSGSVFDANGAIIRESFGTKTNMGKYVAGLTEPPRATTRMAGTVLPLATTRSDNFCRWWLDSMSKPFLAECSHEPLRSAALIAAPPRSAFQEAGLAVLDGVAVASGEQIFVGGDIVGTSGLTFAGGQRIAKRVVQFGEHMGRRLARQAGGSAAGAELVFISRRDTSIRRIVDEDAVFAALEPFGFVRVDLAELSMTEQYVCFSKAKVIVSPHGAGLTNLLWSPPGAKLVEIFPDGGVHGSAFLRIASQKQLDYFAFVGRAGLNRDSKRNPNNADIIIDPVDLKRFVGEEVLGSARSAAGSRQDRPATPQAESILAQGAAGGASVPPAGGFGVERGERKAQSAPVDPGDASGSAPSPDQAAQNLLAVPDVYARDDKGKYKNALKTLRSQQGMGDLCSHLWSSFRSALRSDKAGVTTPNAFDALPVERKLLAIEAALRIADPTRLIFLKDPGNERERLDEAVAAGLNRYALEDFRESQRQRKSIFNHHASLVIDGKMVIRSPISGNLIESSASFVVYDKRGQRIRPNILYYFYDSEPVIAVEDSLFGDIWGLYLPERDLSLVRRSLSPANILYTFAALAMHYLDGFIFYLNNPAPRQKAVLVAAIEHLGHSVLGDFEGLNKFGDFGLLGNIDAVVRGPVEFYDHELLFPELRGKPVIPTSFGHQSFKLMLDRNVLLIRPISTTLWFSRELRSRFQSMFSERNLGGSPTGASIADVTSHRPVVWFELRTNDRYWTDQIEGFVNIATSLQSEFPGATIVLAGWSLPPLGSRTDDDQVRIEADQALAREIIGRLPGMRVIDITGVSPMEKGAWACAIDSHVSTFGSGIVFPNGMGGKSGVILINEIFAGSLEAKHINRGSMSQIEDPGHTHYIVVASRGSETGKGYDQCFDVDWRVVLEKLKRSLGSVSAAA